MRPLADTIKDAALEYAKNRLRVVPLHTVLPGERCSCRDESCTSQGKHPRTPHGVNDASCAESEVRAYWRKWPKANVGIATGAGSGIAVLDVDPRHGGTESLAHLEKKYGGLPVTARVATGGGGLHVYFAHPGGRVPNRSQLDGLPASSALGTCPRFSNNR